MNHIKIFQNAQTISVSVVNSYTEDHLIHIFLDNFHQGRKYTAQIESHQEYLRRKGKITDQKYLSVSSLQNDYSNIDRSSGSVRKNERENLVQVKCTFVEVTT